MAAPVTTDEFLDLVRKSGVADEKRFDVWLTKAKSSGLPAKPTETAGLLVRDGVLTAFQAEQILQGKWRRFTIGKYKVLERLGQGGMASVYLCEHKLMRRRVAVKVLPTAKAQDESARERFYREARAVAALDHPNIVHAYDIDQDESLHFLVMEYVDGASLQDIVKASGPLDVSRACHYIHQAALGLQHAHQAGLIHRDIKPSNILVDRSGVVKILDMGLARFFNDEEDNLTKKFDENVLGTADYLAPEQAVDSHDVDIRADIYSLGATFYYLLTGKTPFGEGTVAQKLLWHQSRRPKPVTDHRPDIPQAVAAIVAKMMAREKEQRYQTPGEVAKALEPFVQTAIAAPTPQEMPKHLQTASSPPNPELVDTAVVQTHGVTPTAPKALQGMSSSKNVAPVKKPTTPSLPASTSPSRPAAPPPPPKPVPVNTPAPPKAEVSPPPLPAKPVTRPPQPAVEVPQPTATAVADTDEDAPWDKLAAEETDDPSAKADTPPRSTRTLPKVAAQPLVANLRRAKLVVTTIAVGAALIVVGLLLYLLMSRETPPRGIARKPLEVTKELGRPNTYRSIEAALRVAEPGDVIQLLDADYRETLLVEPRHQLTTSVTIEAAPGREVVWRPAAKDENRPILTLQKARGFKINGKGLTFDGAIDEKRRLKDLIAINFDSPGLAIEDATFTNFSRCAVSIVNAGGAKDRPIRLLNLKYVVGAGLSPDAAVLFDAKADIEPPQNQYIELLGGSYGGLVAAKEVSNAANGVQVSWPK